MYQWREREKDTTLQKKSMFGKISQIDPEVINAILLSRCFEYWYIALFMLSSNLKKFTSFIQTIEIYNTSLFSQRHMNDYRLH